MARIVFMFPGQGSQKVGMGRDFADRNPDLVERYFKPADEILGYGLTDLCFNGPEEQLRSTDNTGRTGAASPAVTRTLPKDITNINLVVKSNLRSTSSSWGDGVRSGWS